MTRRTVLALMLAGVFSAGCSDLFGPHGARADLDAARDKWHRSGVHSYVYTFTRECFCNSGVGLTAQVVNDSVVLVVSAKPDSSGNPLPGASTIDEWFGFIDNAISNGPEHLDVHYNSTFGYPESIDYNSGVPDVWLRLTISSFTPGRLID
jgi:hypothetical protein